MPLQSNFARKLNLPLICGIILFFVLAIFESTSLLYHYLTEVEGVGSETIDWYQALFACLIGAFFLASSRQILTRDFTLARPLGLAFNWVGALSILVALVERFYGYFTPLMLYLFGAGLFVFVLWWTNGYLQRKLTQIKNPICQHLATPQDSRALYCPTCGVQVATKCNKCGEKVANEWGFCAACGQSQ